MTSSTQQPSTKPSPVFLVSWAALESALNLLASPAKADQIAPVISALRKTQPSVPPEKLLVQILSATAWLTSDDTSSSDGEAPMS